MLSDWGCFFFTTGSSFEFTGSVCVCVRCSAFHVQAHHPHSPGLIEVWRHFFFNPSYCSPSFSYLLYRRLSDPFSPVFFISILFFLSFLLSFLSTNPQSLDQVALTNATILDGSGGGPNGSLAGSVGSVAVCLPSESSLTDSLHTSAVSLHRIDVGSRNNLYDRK